MNLLEQIKENAKKHNMRIVLPEGLEERTLQAADQVIAEGIARVFLIGPPDKIKSLAKKYKLAKTGDKVVVCAGHPFGYSRETNLIKVFNI